MKKKIAVIGSGLSGLSFAKFIRSDVEVHLFDKSRGFGGRMATRRESDYQFDHGAQYFTVKTTKFKTFLAPYLSKGIVQPWLANFVELDRNKIIHSKKWTIDSGHYVGAPYMSSLCREIANEQNVFLNTEITKVEKKNDNWELTDSNNNKVDGYDWVVFAVTPQHVQNIMQFNFDGKSRLTSNTLSACYSIMLGFKNAFQMNWEAALVTNSHLGWVSINSSKPGRQGGFSILAQSTNIWAEKNINMDVENVEKHLIDELSDILKVDVRTYDFARVHKWRYANIKQKQKGKGYYINSALKIISVGDWHINARVESAFLSGYKAAKKMNEIM